MEAFVRVVDTNFRQEQRWRFRSPAQSKAGTRTETIFVRCQLCVRAYIGHLVEQSGG